MPKSKLSPEQRADIIREHQTGKVSQVELGKQYNVSTQTIHFIVHPEKLLKNKEQAKKRPYDPISNSIRGKKYRAKKKQLKK